MNSKDIYEHEMDLINKYIGIKHCRECQFFYYDAKKVQCMKNNPFIDCNLTRFLERMEYEASIDKQAEQFEDSHFNLFIR